MALSKYEPAISSIIKAIEPLDDLLKTINVPYKNYGCDDLRQSDAAQIFGGFLRWVVETVELGKDVTLEAFLLTGSDIDVAISSYCKSGGRLARWFKKIIENGGSIEYAGMEYGKKDLMDVTFNLADHYTDSDATHSKPFTPGNYMVYAVLPGGHRVKFDVIVDGKEKTDFTVNALRYPSVSGQRRDSDRDYADAIDDIINRRIFRATAEVNPKLVYRALKLLRRGYKFANDNSFWRMIFIASGDFQTKRKISKREQRKLELVHHAFTVDTNVPSRPIDFGAMVIRSTGHPVTVIDKAFLFEQKDFRVLWERIDPVCRPFQTLWPFCGEIAARKIEEKEWQDESVRVLEKETIVYKICNLVCLVPDIVDLAVEQGELSCETTYEVCIALKIPSGTRYICEGSLRGYKIYRFELAYVHAVYAYPNVDISKILLCGLEDVQPDDPRLEDPVFRGCWHAEGTHPVQIKSPQRQGFTYTLNKILYAELNGVPTPLDPESQHGLYAFSDIDVAWLNYSHDRKLFVGDIPHLKKILVDVKSKV